jgi:arsenate reductase
MAEGFLRSFDETLEVFSAGTAPASRVSSRAIAAMEEIGIDISGHKPKNVNEFVTQSFDYVITVCDSANELCPVFTGDVRHRLHIGFDDPSWATGTEEEVLNEFRRVRDEIKHALFRFYQRNILRQ